MKKCSAGPGAIGSIRIGFTSDYEQSDIRRLYVDGKINVVGNEIWAYSMDVINSLEG